jgi:hypothetical protein
MEIKSLVKILFVFFSISILQIGCASNDDIMTEGDSREITGTATFTATVLAVDLEKRELTLGDQNSEGITFVVDERVKRLDEIMPGDKIKMEYYLSLVSEIREPTETEKDAPLTVLEDLAKAPADTSPAGGGLRQIRAVVTVKDIDLERNLVTIKGPMGRYLTLKPLYPERLKLVKVEDTVIITYTEALILSLEKVE